MHINGCKKGLDGFFGKRHLPKVMLIVCQKLREAKRAAIAAARGRSFGGDYAWPTACSMPSQHTSQGLEPNVWRGG
jgi:hypothetical protein